MDETTDPLWATTDSLSEEGVFLRTTQLLPTDAVCLLKIFNGTTGDLWVRAKVVHHIPGVGFGCEFTQIEPRMRARLITRVLTQPRDTTLELDLPERRQTDWGSN